MIRLERIDDAIVLVTLDRPEARNAISRKLAEALETIVEQVEADPTIRTAIITGAGSAFCAGADLREVAQGKLAETFTAKGGFAGFVNADRRKIWIAAVNGMALAGGFEIVLACDLVVAARSAAFGLPEVRRGLIASAGGLYRLPRALPKAIALELILSGNPMPAERAFDFGLVNRLANDDVVVEATELAMSISRNAPLALAASIAIAREAAGFDDLRLRQAGDDAQETLSRTADYEEGARAFLEKRAPRWKGA